MQLCPLCGLQLDDTDLSRHYLKNARLIDFIRLKHLDWDATTGACSRCLESYYRDLYSGAIREERSEETTVITHPSELISADSGTESACFITIHGADLGKKFDLSSGESTLGRGENTAIRINEDNISRNHARIYRSGNEVIIEDLKSTNGTFVNTKKITSQPLKDGDLVLVGNTILKFVSGSNVENRYHDEIYRLATMDGLTQIYNKSFFIDRAAEEFGRSKRYRRDLSLILFDFDHFKRLNDTYGHLAGDEVLKKSASLVMRSMRKEDVIGRYGGEEIGVLLPETSLETAVTLAEKIRKMIEQTEFASGDKTYIATISVGVAALNPDLADVNQLVELADRALYRAKKDGRNCVRT